MLSNLQIKYLSISMLICLVLAACTTMQPVKENSTTEEILIEIKPGDEIRLVTKTGEQHHNHSFFDIERLHIWGRRAVQT